MKIDISKYKDVQFERFCRKCGKKLILYQAYIDSYEPCGGRPTIYLRWVCPNAFLKSKYFEGISNHWSYVTNEKGE